MDEEEISISLEDESVGGIDFDDVSISLEDDIGGGDKQSLPDKDDKRTKVSCGPSVLLVEDDSNVRLSIKAMLQEMGISNISEAADGVEALRLIEGDPKKGFGFVVCDWNMPKKTGLELLRDVRETNKKTPFLMITARANKDSVALAKKHDVTAYIVKPFTFNELKAKVSAICGI